MTAMVTLRYVFRTAGIVFLAALLVRSLLLAQIPAQQKTIPVRATDEKVPVPRRPGTRSIRIVGPPLKTLKFQVDFRRNPQPLDWAYLERVDKRADIMVEGEIDALGRFRLTKVVDRGHPRAGRYIRGILSSWTFVRYKQGTIRYYFNVPTRLENMKVQIDTRDLRKNFKTVGPNDLVSDGLLFYIEGLSPRNIMLINK